MPEDILPHRKPSYEWGWLDIEQFVQKLSQEGITDAKVEHGNPGYIIHLVIALIFIFYSPRNC